MKLISSKHSEECEVRRKMNGGVDTDINLEGFSRDLQKKLTLIPKTMGVGNARSNLIREKWTKCLFICKKFTSFERGDCSEIQLC